MDDLLTTGFIFTLISTAIKWATLKKYELEVSIPNLLWLSESSDVLIKKELLIVFIAQSIGVFWILAWLMLTLISVGENVDILSLVFFYLPFVVLILLAMQYKKHH